jgi:F0F1-type ATP synthase assembly protein I
LSIRSQAALESHDSGESEIVTDNDVSHDGGEDGRDSDAHRDRRALNKGFSDGMARAFELALTPVIFGGLGWLVDRATGTAPLFMLTFVLFAFAGMFVRMWIGYDNEMRRHENTMAWNRNRSTKAPGPV